MCNPGGGIRQLGFVTGDAEAAARRWLDYTNAGPFFLIRGLRFAGWSFHGAPQDLVLDIAFAQSGEMMLEFIQPTGEWPNVYGERPLAPDAMLPHHHGYLVDDMAVAEAALGGIVPTTRASIGEGAELRYYDMRSTLGLFVELIQNGDTARGFFDTCRQAAAGWAGSDPLRIMEYTAA